MKRSRLGPCLSAVLFVSVCLLPTAARADSTDRSGRWEFSFPINYLRSEFLGSSGGSSVEISDDYGLGIGFGFNFNEHFNVAFDFTAVSTSFDARVATDDPMNPSSRIGGTLDSSTFQVSGQYNILAKSITPYIRGGLGSTYVDTNIPNGPPVGTCWWHPWWGYICDTWVPTVDDSSFSYSGGVGVRFEVTEVLYLDLSGNKLWIDWDEPDTTDFTGYRLKLGWAF